MIYMNTYVLHQDYMELRPVVLALQSLPDVVRRRAQTGFTKINLSAVLLCCSLRTWWRYDVDVRHDDAYGVEGALHAWNGLLLCTSCATALSYDLARWRHPVPMTRLRQQVGWQLDTLAHYLPFLLLDTTSSPISLGHVLGGILMHATWGYNVQFDLNVVYELQPPLTATQMCRLWWIAMLGHWLPYVVWCFCVS